MREIADFTGVVERGVFGFWTNVGEGAFKQRL